MSQRCLNNRSEKNCGRKKHRRKYLRLVVKSKESAIAGLDYAGTVCEAHVAEAVQYGTLDRALV
jgi:hypothetical protein